MAQLSTMKIFALLFFFLFTSSLYSQSQVLTAYNIGEKHTIYSKILNEDREIFVHVPNGFWGLDEKLERYPIVFVLDGESQFLNTVSALDFISSAPMGNDLMPRSIVIGIPNTNRDRDFTPTKGRLGRDSLEQSGGGKKFLEFIATELTPYLDSVYATSEHRTIIGHSLGGLIVFEALLNHRKHYNNYLAIDPAMFYDNESYFQQVIDTLETANLNEENLFIARASTIPTFINPTNIENDTSQILDMDQSNLKFMKLAELKNWNINYSFIDYPNENHFSVPYMATYDGMKFFYSYYPFKEIMNYYHHTYETRTDLVEKLQEHYKQISKQLGYEIHPLESYINSWAYGLDHFGRRDLTIDMFDYNIKLYPNSPTVYNTKGHFLLNHENENEAIRLFEKSLSIKENEDIRKVLEELKLDRN